MARFWPFVAGATGCMAFLVFVWPTPYEYTRKAPDIWRVNRFTGVREIATDDGWKTPGQVEADKFDGEEYVR